MTEVKIGQLEQRIGVLKMEDGIERVRVKEGKDCASNKKWGLGSNNKVAVMEITVKLI